MISKFKKFFTPLIAIISQPFLSWNPNLISFFGLLPSLLFFVALINHWYIVAVLSFVGFILDAVDGYVARKKGKSSAFGGFLDSTLDRVADFLLIAAFGYASIVSWSLVFLTLTTGFLVSYTRSRGELALKGEKSIAEGLFQRTERILLIFLATLSLFFPWGILTVTWVFVFLLIMNTFTFIQRILLFQKLLA